MTSADLWPPLALIRRSLIPEASAPHAKPARVPADTGTAGAPRSPVPDAEALLLPLTELARRRDAVAQRSFGSRWAPGRLLSVQHDGRLLGVLLDRAEPGTAGAERWHGWLAAAEADWAGAFDLLLEPQDEPFEPVLGVVQAWNPVTLVNTPALCARVQGELSPTRLAAVRALADQAQNSPPGTGAEDAQPGRIALRSVDGLSVLTGTPLGAANDPRQEYQSLYTQVARQLVASQPAPVPQAMRGPAASAAGWGERLRGWLVGSGGSGLWRPAATALALVLVVQNAAMLGFGTAGDDSVRLRGTGAVPTQPQAATAPDLRIAWRPGTDMAAAAALLRQADAQVIAGPDAQGTWSLQLLHPEEGRRVLQSSALVELR
ncbi:MAG: hypothetical protein EOO29_19820 [Comamonadaceae bacterium]|nr:MAG: hypothetical protein EOO29_19820 [Comamonadaceae bacterium]